MRASGILLHPTSLPNSLGIGTIGKEAFRFVDWLESANQTLWQILPLGPTGYGDSPYASFSTFAGNPLLIDLPLLVQDGFLSHTEIPAIAQNNFVDFGKLVEWKIPILKKAAERFFELITVNSKLFEEYTKFKKTTKYWLFEYCTFMSIKEYYDKKASKENRFGCMWNNYWDKSLALHESAAVKKWQNAHKKEIKIYAIIQFFFFRQWHALKKYANSKNIRIIGDIPIFVAPDSADVWSNQKLFLLKKNGEPKVVAGVPPDYFSETGQLWGNPLYNWKIMKEDKYEWWIERIKACLTLVDSIRIDHFRGFEAYWAVPFGEKTAINGKWCKAPGIDFFTTVQKKLGKIPLIAEDLGVITKPVRQMRDFFNFPGMKVLQFAFNPDEIKTQGFTNAFLPHNHIQHCIVYTGTHDNDTLQGYINNASDEEINVMLEYINRTLSMSKITADELCDALIALAFFSPAMYAIVPLQDIFALDSSTRMNMPSSSGGINWQWRMQESHFSQEKAEKLKKLAWLSSRNVPFK